MIHPTIETLRRLRLTGMAKALEEQQGLPDCDRLSFDERLAMLVDREAVERDNAALAQRLRLAKLRQAACLEDVDYRTPRGLDRSLIHSLASGRWLHEHNNVLILGPTGSGKSFLACAIGNQAARGGFSVRYQRLTRLLDELALARVDGLGGEGDEFAAGVFVSLHDLTLLDLLASCGIMRPKRDPGGGGALVSIRAGIVGEEPLCRWRRTLLPFTPIGQSSRTANFVDARRGQPAR